MIVVEPQDTNGTAGETARLHCNATGFPIPDIIWFKNGTPVSDLNNMRFVATRTEITEGLLAVGILSIHNPVLSDNGLYSCNASNYLKTADVVSSDRAELFLQCELHVAPLSLTDHLHELPTTRSTIGVSE